MDKNLHQMEDLLSLMKKSKGSTKDFVMSVLSFHQKNGFITKKQSAAIAWIKLRKKSPKKRSY